MGFFRELDLLKEKGHECIPVIFRTKQSFKDFTLIIR